MALTSVRRSVPLLLALLVALAMIALTCGIAKGSAQQTASMPVMCGECADQESPPRCKPPEPADIRQSQSHPGPCSVPGSGQSCDRVAGAWAPQAFCGSAAEPVPPDLHLLQTLRV